MYIIGTHKNEDRLFCDFGLDEVIMATNTIIVLRNSGYDVFEVKEHEYKERLDKFKRRSDEKKNE